MIIGQLVEAMRDGIDTVNDRTTLEEMLTFVKNDKLRPEAEEGAHDDCVMALAIAWYLRPSQRMTPETKEAEGKVAWTQDQWDDYYNADEDGKKYLVKKWGEPKR